MNSQEKKVARDKFLFRLSVAVCALAFLGGFCLALWLLSMVPAQTMYWSGVVLTLVWYGTKLYRSVRRQRLVEAGQREVVRLQTLAERRQVTTPDAAAESSQRLA